jgi:hypothetical protein
MNSQERMRAENLLAEGFDGYNKAIPLDKSILIETATRIAEEYATEIFEKYKSYCDKRATEHFDKKEYELQKYWKHKHDAAEDIEHKFNKSNAHTPEKEG